MPKQIPANQLLDHADQLLAAEQERARLDAILHATAEALHLPADGDPNHIPAAAAAAYDAAKNLREQLDRANLARQHAQEQLDAQSSVPSRRAQEPTDVLARITHWLRSYDLAEDVEDVLERHYTGWPDTAVTSAHHPIALEVLSLLADRVAARAVPELVGVLEAAGPSAEETARLFHNTYEKLAPQFGYQTREASRVPWSEVPEQNRALMVATCAKLLDWLRRGAPGGRPVEPPARAFLGDPVCDKPDCPCRAPKLATSAPVEKPVDLHFGLPAAGTLRWPS